MLQNGKRRSAPFLDIRNLVTAGGEQGLLGLAFHPSYPKVRKLYVQYTARDGSTKVVEYRTNGTRASSPRLLFSSRDPYGNHNGGMLAFGPNGRLHFTMGDGGSGGDPENRAQNPRSLFGKLLSLNVATKGLRDRGVRPAQRVAVLVRPGEQRPLHRRRRPGVGRGDRLHPCGQPRARELRLGRLRGALEVRGQGRRPRQARLPGRAVQPRRRAARSRAATSTAARTPSLRGRYIYGDYCSGLVWSFKIAGGKATALRQEAFKIANLTSFGEDTAGELYAVSQGGTIYRLTP